MPRTVRGRTTVLALTVVLASLLIASVGLLVFQRQVLQSSLDDQLRQRASDLGARIEAGADISTLLDGVVGEDTLAQVVGSDGVVMATTSQELSGPVMPVAGRSIGDEAVFDYVAPGHDTVRVARLTVAAPTGAVLTIYAGASTENIRESVSALTRGLLIAIPLLLALLGLVLWQVTGRALRPVAAIRTRAESIGAGDLHQRVPGTGAGDEIDRLAETMNRMLGRLEASSETQKAFVADASHELRTPLTGIITQLESARTGDELDSYREATTVTLVEANRMRRLIEDLLVLARSDRPGVPLRRDRPIDVDDVILEEARLAPRRDLHVDTSLVSAGQIRGNGDATRRIVRNLLDNATSHAASRVRIELNEVGGTVTLKVGDDGPGIPPNDRERVFERFVRLDDARARFDGGTGLGLAITKTLVEGLGGRVEVGDSSLGGAEFIVELPAFTQ